MNAIVYEGPGKLGLRDVPVPKPAAKGDVLIKVHYGGICGTDMVVWQGRLTRVVPPVVLGHEFIGTVEEALTDEVKAGDRVVVEPLISCGQCLACRSGDYHVCRTLKLQGVDIDGGFTKYVVSPISKVFKVPATISDREGALVEPLAVAVHMVRRAVVQMGDYVVVLGAGPIGMLVACVAREAGAKQVVLVEVNPYRIDLARGMGFKVINSATENVKDIVLADTDMEGADVTFELAGRPATASLMTDITRIRGTILQGSVFSQPAPIQLQHVTLKEQSMIGSRVYKSKDYLSAIKLLNDKRVDVKPLISVVLPLCETIDKGFEAIKRGDPLMKVLIDPEA